MFNFIKQKLQTLYRTITGTQLDEATLKEIEKTLLEADAGMQATRSILTQLKQKASSEQPLTTTLADILTGMLTAHTYTLTPDVYLLVGINGSGKTTTAAKIAYREQKTGKTVLFVAGDTFRAAATAQLSEWATQLHIPLVMGKENQDPASVIYAGCERYKQEKFDTLVIDTAGRLQTKVNLMKELEKIRRTISKLLPDARVATLLTIDSMLGQNSLVQARLFHESTPLDGIILTKADGTGKGGIIFAITQELGLPIAFITSGEQMTALTPFHAQEFVASLLKE